MGGDAIETYASGPRRPRKKVKAACERCRKQKLGCDEQRPCSMCLRSGRQCNPATESSAEHPAKRRRFDAPLRNPSARSGAIPPENILATPIAVGVSCTTVSQPLGGGTTHGNVQEDDLSLREHLDQKSAVHLTREIFDRFDSSPGLNEGETYALPGGKEVSEMSEDPAQEPQIPLIELVGVELPPKEVTDFLLDTYLESVHWFMMAFHEPTFRVDYEKVVATRAAPRRKFGFVVLLVVVLLMGCRYSTPESAEKNCPGLDVQSLQNNLQLIVKNNTHDLYDETQIEVVQSTILLCSFYFYNARPNLALAVLAAGVKSAQVMGLHRESSWRTNSVLVREIRRRTWWALYVADRFGSIAYGGPCSINDSDCDVAMVEDLDDASAQHPRYHSKETLDDGTQVPVTIFSYQRFKFRLYRISSTILGNGAFLRGATKAQVFERVRKTHEQLIEWFRSLPQELLPEKDSPDLDMLDKVEKTFRLQAVTLALAYDNVMILLHRPLLQYNFESSVKKSLQISVPGEPVDSPDMNVQLLSKRQCWDSALRTSKLTELVDVLRFLKNTHAAAYTGIQMFTAGILLSIVALSDPRSSQAHEAKQAIACIIRLSKALGHKTILSTQSGNILEALFKVILAKEMKHLISEQNLDTQDDGMLATRAPTPQTTTQNHNMHALNLQDYQTWISQPDFNQPQIPYDPPMPSFHMYNDTLSAALGNTDFNEGLSSLQEVLRTNTNPFAMEENTPMQMSSHEGLSLNNNAAFQQPLTPSTANIENWGSLIGGSYGSLNDTSQTWMWEMAPAPY